MRPFELHCGDCLEVLRTLPDNSVDAVITDPPAGIGFMAKGGKDHWDSDKGGRLHWIAWLAEVMTEVRRVLKPGGHALVWSLNRTSHWTATALEDAGFEVRDAINYLHDAGTDWQNFLESLSADQMQAFEIALASQVDTGFETVLSIFGSGFPKGQNISLKIDELLGKERTVVGKEKNFGRTKLADGKTGLGDFAGEWNVTAPASDEAARLEGWKTQLKPSVETWWLVRKPIEKGLTIVENVLKYGCGGLNVGACAVGESGGRNNGSKIGNTDKHVYGTFKPTEKIDYDRGRYPANLIVDGSDAAEAVFPDTGQNCGGRKGEDGKRQYLNTSNNGAVDYRAQTTPPPNAESDPKTNDWFIQTAKSPQDGGGSASRYFYHAKVSPTDRNEGCEGFELKTITDGRANPLEYQDKFHAVKTNVRNTHPTCKNNELMRYLCRLITPPNGLILDCFMGSGSTGKAAMQEGFRFIGIEQNPEYVAIAEARILWAIQQTGLTPEKAEALTLSNPTGINKPIPLNLF